MNISKINNISQNFGLRKTERYKKAENIYLLDRTRVFTRALDFSEAILKLMPGAVLDFDEKTKRFILKDDKDGDTYLSQYDLCGIEGRNPDKKMEFLYNQILFIERGNHKKKISYDAIFK